MQKALLATITQTPRRVEPPFGILELPRFETTSPRRNLIKVADSSFIKDEQWSIQKSMMLNTNLLSVRDKQELSTSYLLIKVIILCSKYSRESEYLIEMTFVGKKVKRKTVEVR